MLLKVLEIVLGSFGTIKDLSRYFVPLECVVMEQAKINEISKFKLECSFANV